jgi:Tfp pilus assembly protein PilO
MTKEKKVKKEKDVGIKIGDFLIPIVSGVIFLILLFFNFIPTVREASSTIEETEKIRQKQQELEERIELVKTLDYVELQNTLTDARRVVPTTLEVAEYAHYVHRLAAEKNLRFVGIKAEDDFTPFLGGIQNIKAVKAPLQYRGSFEDITEFFNELQEYSPYIVSMEEIELRKMQYYVDDEEDEGWMFEITVAGYYFTESDSDALNSRELIRLPFTPYSRNNEEIVQIFQEKAKRLETGGRPVN